MHASRRRPLKIAVIAILSTVALLVPVSITPAGAATPGPAPVIRLLDPEGSIKVDCGPLPEGATAFEAVGQRTGGPVERAALPAGATSITVSIRLDVVYQIACRSRSAGGWSPLSAITTTRYPDLTLPVLRVDTTNSAPIVSRDDYLKAQVSVNPNGAAGVPALTASAKIRGRGNSTWIAPTDKKPYKLKLDAAAPLLGLPADKNWALLANYYDRTMLREALAFSWGNASSLAWTPRTVFVELILNGDYRGVYQVAETVDVAPSRVAVDPMSATDDAGAALTGGYLAEIDAKAGTQYGDPGDVTHVRGALSGTPFTIKDPDPPTDAQIGYLQQQIDTAENDIAADANGDPQAYARLGSELDLQSFADWYVISEMARNYDSWYSSSYLYKPRNGPLTMGPLWDFDLSMGTYFFSKQPSDDAWVRGRSPWFDYLLKDPRFLALVKSRYAVLRPTIVGANRTIDGLDRQIRTARANDAVRWGYTENLDGQVSELRQWLSARQRWFDATYR